MKIWYYSNQVTRHIKDHQGSYQGSSRHNRLPWTDFACRLSWANPWQNEGCRSLLPQHTQKRRKPYSFRRENCMVISKHMETISRSSRSSIISSLIIYGHPTNPSLWRWLKYQFPSVYIYILCIRTSKALEECISSHSFVKLSVVPASLEAGFEMIWTDCLMPWPLKSFDAVWSWPRCPNWRLSALNRHWPGFR